MKATPIAGLVAAALVAGCASSPATHFYSLAPASTAAARTNDAAAEAAPPAISIGAIGLPEQVDRPQIVTVVPSGDGIQRIAISEQNRWAASLQAQIGQLLGERLSAALGAPYVTAYPQDEVRAPDVRLTVNVQRFDAQLGVETVVDALWLARNTSTGETRSGRKLVRLPITGGGVRGSDGADAYQSVVAAYAASLDQIAADIVEGIRGVFAGSRK